MTTASLPLPKHKRRSAAFKSATTNYASMWSRARTESLGDIKILPQPVNLRRREACRYNLHQFLIEYFPNSTGLNPLGEAQIRAVQRIQHAILKSGRFLNVFPRGYVKTTITENAVIWAAVYGHRRYAIAVGATDGLAKKSIDAICTELIDNELLAEDFPEYIQPIQHIGSPGKAPRCNSQTYQPGYITGNPALSEDVALDDDAWDDDALWDAEQDVDADPGCPVGNATRTYINWHKDKIVLPTLLLPENWGTTAPLNWQNLITVGGTVIEARSLTSANRGLKHKIPDGSNIRPDLIILDDPQTDASAASPPQTSMRLNVLDKSLMRLGGHATPVSLVVNATCIADGDMVDHLSNPEEYPSFEVERIKAVPRMPSDSVLEEHWLGRYKSIRNAINPLVPGDRDRAYREATEYYIANRRAMDGLADGHPAETSWPWMPIFEVEHEISALQHCLNVLIDDGEAVFSSELQNQPKRVQGAAGSILPHDHYQHRTNGFVNKVVPESHQNYLVAGIDVHDHVLYYSVAAVSSVMGGGIIHYGTWPEQRESDFKLQYAKRTLQGRYKQNREESIRLGIMDLVGMLCGQNVGTAGINGAGPANTAHDGFIWRGSINNPDGTPRTYQMNQIVIDYGWAPEQVRHVVENSEHKAILAAYRGNGITPAKKPMPDYDTKRMRRAGPDPRAPRWYWAASQQWPLYECDTYYWSDVLMERFNCRESDQSAWKLWGGDRDASKHSMWAQHLTSEEPTLQTKDGRSVNKWIKKLNHDNHYRDSALLCLIAASIAGAQLPGAQAPTPAKRQRRSLKELKAMGGSLRG